MKIFYRLIIILMTLSSMRQVTPAAAGGGGSSPAARTDGAIGINEAADSLTQDMVLNLRCIPAGNPILSQQDRLKNIVLSIMEKLATLYPTLPHLIILSDVSANLTKAGRSAENWIDPRYLFCVKKMLTKVTTAYKGERVTDNKMWLPEELNALLDRYIGEEAASIEAMAFPAAPLAVTLSRSVSTATLGGGAASGGGSSSSATAPGDAGAPAALAVAAPLGRIVATSAIVGEMFNHPYTCQVNTATAYCPDALSPLECALRIASLNFNNQAVIDEMIAIIEDRMESGSGDFLLELNALLATINYNGDSLLQNSMAKRMEEKAPGSSIALVPSHLNPWFKDLLKVQAAVIASLKMSSVIVNPDDSVDKTNRLHGHEFCSPFFQESSENSLMRIRCLGKYITFLPANLSGIDISSDSLKSGAGRVLRQALVILGRLPASPQTFIYGKQLEQLMIALKKSAAVNVVIPDIDQKFAQIIVGLLTESDEKEMIKHLIQIVRDFKLAPEVIVDHLQLIVQLSANTDLEIVAYAVFKKVALGFAFGLNKAQIVDVLETGKLY